MPVASVKPAVSVIPWGHPYYSNQHLSAQLGGQSIATESRPHVEGTLGLYVLVKGVKCAIVSRHVVAAHDSDTSDLSGTRVIMPGQHTYKDIYEYIKLKLDHYRAQEIVEGPHLTLVTRHKAESLKEELGTYCSVDAHLAELKDTASRCIGEVLFSPCREPLPLEGPEYEGKNQFWLPDYALVQLSNDRLNGDLNNTIQIDTSRDDRDRASRYSHQTIPPNGPLRLKGTFSLGDGRVVGKHGKSSGLT